MLYGINATENNITLACSRYSTHQPLQVKRPSQAVIIQSKLKILFSQTHLAPGALLKFTAAELKQEFFKQNKQKKDVIEVSTIL